MNIADENAEIVRRGYQVLDQADLEALTRLFHRTARCSVTRCSPPV
jgi:hypothetical protein